MGVLSIHHVSLVVADTQKAVEFYSQVLGLKVCDDRPDMSFPGAWLEIGEQQVHLLEVDNPDPVTGRPAHGGRDRHLAMTVDDLDAFERALKQRELPYTKSQSGRAALFCRDPDGNGIELIQQPT